MRVNIRTKNTQKNWYQICLNSGNRGKNLFAATDAKKNRFLAPFVRRGSPLPVPYLSVRVRGSI